MKLSKLIDTLSKDLETYGDTEVRYYKIVDQIQSSSGYMYSPTRRNKNGEKAKMNHKELIEYIQKESNETNPT